MQDEVRIPRSLATAKELVQAIELHVFGDTSEMGRAADVYAVAHQESGPNQGLVTAKAPLAKSWIAGKGNYKLFLSNRVAEINTKDYIQWGHVSSGQNRADVGSRGSSSKELQNSG